MKIAYVGAGGKTTLLKRRAGELHARGLKVLIATSTRMFIEENTLLTDDPDEILCRLSETGLVMAGVPCGEKIAPLSPETLRAVQAHADAVLIEADGSRHLPLKHPAPHEPVIDPDADEIIVVCGMHALGRPAGEVCQRMELAEQHLGFSPEEIITPEHILRLALKAYIHPLQSAHPRANIRFCAAHDGSEPQLRAAESLISAMQARGVPCCGIDKSCISQEITQG